jgi:hypothetical protein
MAIIGVASIRVRPDLTRFRSELDAGLRKIDRDFKVNVRADTSQASRDVDRFAKQINQKNAAIRVNVDRKRIQKDLGDISREVLKISEKTGVMFLKGTAGAVVFAVALASVASALTGTASLVGGLGQAIVALGGAAVGVGAGGLAALAAGVATVKLGMVGMSDAFKAISEGDAKALNEALKKMSPAGREFVREIAKFKPVLDQLRLDVQQNLFKDLAKEVQLTGNAVSRIARGQFTELSKVLNNVAKDTLGFFREARTLKELESISKNVTSGFRESQGAAKSLASAIVDIVSAGSELLPELGRGLEGVTARFAAFIRGAKDSGRLTEFFRQSIETIKQFGRILRDFGVGIANVFRIGSETGGGFLNILERAATGFRNFTESAQGREVLTRIFETIRTLAEAFSELLSNLRPVLGPLGQFAELVANGLASALDRLGPKLRDALIKLFEKLTVAAPDLIDAVEKIAEAVIDLIDAIAPFVPAIADIINEMADFSGPTTVAMVAALALIGGKMGLVVAAGVGLGIALIKLGQGVHDVVNSIGDDVEALGQDLQKLGGPFGILGKGIEIFGSGIGTDTTKVRQLLRDQGVDIGYTLLESVTAGVAKAQAEALVPGVNGAVTQILKIFNGRKGEFTAAGGLTWAEVGRGITTEQQAVVDRLRQAAQALLNVLTGKRDEFATQGKTLSQALANGLTAGQQEAINRVRNIVQSLLDAMTGKRSSFDAEGRAISQRLSGGISAGQSEATNAARGVANAVVGIFGGTSLYGEGASIMASLRGGLVSGIQAVKNVLTSMTSLIPTWKGPESVDKRLLVPAGVEIMRGLIRGIESEESSLERVLSGVTDRFTAAFDTPALRAESVQRMNISGGLEPTRVIVDVNLNEGNLSGIIDGQISENNRTISRFGKAGVTP